MSLIILQQQCADCRRCPHGATRKQTVFAKGDPLSTLCFVGEAPGEDEDEQGLPFVGASGRLLDKQIEAMREHARHVEEEYGNKLNFPDSPYICNVVKCRPPSNKLLKDGSDVAACQDWLWLQLKLLPKLRVVVVLGATAAQTLLDSEKSIGELRGKVNRVAVEFSPGHLGHALKNRDDLDPQVIATYHPSYLLRQPNRKDLRVQVWADLKLAVEALR